MKALTEKQIKANPNNSIRLRVMKAMANLPKTWIKYYMESYPSENNLEGINKIRNIAALRCFDLEKTEQLELLVDKVKHS